MQLLPPGATVDSTQLRNDQVMNNAILFCIVLMSPAQLFIFDQLVRKQYTSTQESSQRDARLQAIPDVTLSIDFFCGGARAAQGLLIVTTLACPRRYPNRRTTVIATSFVLAWLLHLTINLRLLYLSVRNPVLSDALVALCSALALCFHVAMPIAPDRLIFDLIAYVAVVAAHVAGAFLLVPIDEAQFFSAVLVISSVVPITLRCTLYERTKLEHEAGHAKVRASAMRMINHSSKRVMLNVVHAVDMVIRELETSHATGGDSEHGRRCGVVTRSRLLDVT